MIEPLLLVNFVENAFKHSNLDEENAYLKINLQVIGNLLDMKVSNSLAPNQRKDATTGIGLSNVGQRLNMIYPDKHRLNIQSSENNYTVHLTLQL
jgi:two-component system, LytTR family, sensor kinase